MSVIRHALPFLLAAAIGTATTALPQAQQAGDTITVPFSDPSRPGSVKVSLLMGGITVKGSNRRDVLVSSVVEGGGLRQAAAPAGLRRLTQFPGLVITEEANQMSIRATGMPFRGRALKADVEIQVPTRVNLKLSAVNDGDIVVEDADGEIEITNLNGAIHLINVSGSVVANTLNGNMRVTFTRVTSEKAMAFTSFTGDVDVTLPATAKANLKLRSDNGDVFTDFDVQMRPAAAPQTSRRSGGRVKIEVNRALNGAINGGGPEFELRTFNGNIYVRKGPQ
jgi:hypothetical protein